MAAVKQSKWYGALEVLLPWLLTATSAGRKSKIHSTSTKGANPDNAVCTDIKAARADSNSVGTPIERGSDVGQLRPGPSRPCSTTRQADRDRHLELDGLAVSFAARQNPKFEA